MKRRRRPKAHQPGLLRGWIDWVRGSEQMLVQGALGQPLLLLRYPPGGHAAACELRDAWLHLLPLLKTPVAHPYQRMLADLPTLTVVLLRPRNVCTCLGHHHPPGAESRFTRQLSADLSTPVAEIDLAWEAIREWQPRPLAALATDLAPAIFDRIRFQSALLTVLLHELEHAVYPDREERLVRGASDDFYGEVLAELLRDEGVLEYGI